MRRLRIYILLVVAAATLVQCSGERQADQQTDQTTQAVKEVGGQEVMSAIKALQGKVVVVNFWATWCPPCRQEYPDLARLHKTYQNQGLVVLGVSVDRMAPGITDRIQQFAESKGATFQNVLLSQNEVAGLIRSLDPKWEGSIPFTVVFDRKGNQTTTLTGARSFEQFVSVVEPLLPGA